MSHVSLALAAVFVAIVSACHIVAYLLAGVVPFSYCGTGWPPPLVGLAVVFVLTLALTRGLVGLALGVGLAACARVRRGTMLMFAMGATVPVIGEVVISWTELRHIASHAGETGGPGLWRMILVDFALGAVLAAVAGVGTAWWAVSLRDRAEGGRLGSPRVTRLGWMRLAVAGAVVVGLLGCYRFVQCVGAPPTKPRRSAAEGAFEFSLEFVAGRSPRAILAEQATTLLCTSAALGLASARLSRRPSS